MAVVPIVGMKSNDPKSRYYHAVLRAFDEIERMKGWKRIWARAGRD